MLKFLGLRPSIHPRALFFLVLATFILPNLGFAVNGDCGPLTADVVDEAMSSVVSLDICNELYENAEDRAPNLRCQQGAKLGSGVLIDAHHVLTNHHVVSDGQGLVDEIQIHLRDGRRFFGKVKGYDTELDIAVVKIEKSETFPVVAKDVFPARSDDDGDGQERLRPGDKVFTLGQPLGFDYALTFLNVSVLSRLPDSWGLTSRAIEFSGMVNSGNSGGPVFDCKGQLRALIKSTLGYSIQEDVLLPQGLGFGIPQSVIKTMIPILKDSNGEFTGTLLGGLTLTEVPGTEISPPALVVKYRDQRWLDFDLQVNDRVIAINEKALRGDLRLLEAHLLEIPEGEPMTFTIARGQREISLSGVFREFPAPSPENNNQSSCKAPLGAVCNLRF